MFKCKNESIIKYKNIIHCSNINKEQTAKYMPTNYKLCKFLWLIFIINILQEKERKINKIK